jgi:hypothetical protein
VQGRGLVNVDSEAEADFRGVTFTADGNGQIPTVTYASSTTGVVDNGQGSWELSVASGGVSVVNGLAVTNFTLSAPITLPSGMTVSGTLTVSATTSVMAATIGTLALSSSATVTGNTIGYVSLNGGNPTLTGNTIGYVNFNSGTPTISGNTLTDGTPIRISDPNLDRRGFSGNTYTATGPVVDLQGTLTGTSTLGTMDGLSTYVLNGDLDVAWSGALTVSPGVTLRSNGPTIYVDGQLVGTGATIEMVSWWSWGLGTPVLEVRSSGGHGGRLDLTGGTVQGRGLVNVDSGAEADFHGVTFAADGNGQIPLVT